jgi:prepilin-type N-terminal cleavage/methylation domain-containing protein
MTRDRRGFSLVEVLAAMLIIGVTTPLLMGSIIGGLTRARDSQTRSATTVWVQGEIEYVRRSCYNALLSGIGSRYPRKVTRSNLEPGEPKLPAVLEQRDLVAPDAGYVQVSTAAPALLTVTVSYYENDWGGAATPPAPGDVVATTYVAETFSGPCQ